MNLQIGESPHALVQAWGYPSSDGNPAAACYNSLSVSLREARPFYFTFPDGQVVLSREIDAATLAKHLAPVSKGDKNEVFSRVNFVEGPAHYTIIFNLGRDGRATGLWLYSCKHTLSAILRTGDRSRIFDFPLRQSEIAELFGGPMKIGHDFVILGYDCN